MLRATSVSFDPNYLEPVPMKALLIASLAVMTIACGGETTSTPPAPAPVDE
ncbi:hypothetical protein MNBD_ALPHA05-648, partial [hydrothermal vent metagenome]